MVRSESAAAGRKGRRKSGAGHAGGKHTRKYRGWLGRLRAAIMLRVRRVLGIIARIAWAFGWRAGIAGILVFALSVFYFHSLLPDSSELIDTRVRGSVVLLDRNNEVFAWRGDQFAAIGAGHASPNIINAVVAAEDRSFHRHFGISLRGIVGAMIINLREGRGPFSGHGGSTITQQVSKLLCLGAHHDPDSGQSEIDFERGCRKSSIWRKIREIPFAVALELKYSKEEILTIYLNRVYLGSGATGFEAASQRYFGKSIRVVTAPEAAMLAGLLAAPSTYSPTRDLSLSRTRANLVIERMHRQGYLSAAEARLAIEQPATLSPAATRRGGGYFADWIMESGPGFLTWNTTEDVVIRTTFDRDVQLAVDEALTHVFDTRVREGSGAQAAVVVMSRDGAVRAMVGGRDVNAAGLFNRATQALRQTGSLFKPFVYAAALERGFNHDDLVVDEPVTFLVRGSKPWSPRNYEPDYLGAISLTEALAHSINTVAAKLSEGVGRHHVADIARKMGIGDHLGTGPAIALGVSESTLLDMTSAYAGILAGGRSVKPFGLLDMRLRDDDTPLMGRAPQRSEQVFSDQAARQLIYMMHQAVETGTGRRARLDDRPVAGKTGTTQAARDAWFIGFSADYVTGVWMGYDDNTPLTGVTGGGLPAEIWREAMLRIHRDIGPKPLPMRAPGLFQAAFSRRTDADRTGG